MQTDPEDIEPTVGRHKRSHHKTRLVAYCPCRKCCGKVKQKQRAIDDHRTRYPKQDGANRPGSPSNHLSLPSSPALPPAQPTSPASEDGLGDTFEDTIPMSSPPHVDTSQQSSSDRRMSDPELDEDEEEEDPYGLEGINMEVGNGYPFDRLLGDLPNERHNHRYMFGIDEEDDMEFEEDDPENALYNVDFGLPDDGNPIIEAALPRFQPGPDEELTEQPDPLPDDDPDDGGDPEALCAAFQEHELIRNAYIDAFIQKYVYGATHQALILRINGERAFARRWIIT